MKKELTNQDKIRVLSMYIGNAVWSRSHKCNLRGIMMGTQSEPSTKQESYVPYLLVEYEGDYKERSRDLDDVSLLLTPVSEITPEHAELFLSKHKGGYENIICDFKENELYIQFSIKTGGFGHSYVPLYKAYEILKTLGYAVPLFFGIDHWANGKTAIELGMAIPNPTPSN